MGIFGRKGDSADKQAKRQQAKPQEAKPQEAKPQQPQQAAAVMTPVATTQVRTATGEWATLGLVPVAQCVPASPTFSQYNGQLSPVTAETVARLMATRQES